MRPDILHHSTIYQLVNSWLMTDIERGWCAFRRQKAGRNEQLGILLRVEDGGDGDAEVGDRTEEICGFVIVCFCCLSGFRSVG